jgi:predicted nucleic acid-binding protein
VIVTAKVVDASAIVAFLFNEVSRERVVLRLAGATLYAPDLLGFEVANACLKKIRALPTEAETLRQAFSFFFTLDITFERVHLAEALALAEREKLSLYDASYLWLADRLKAELVTLDEKLHRAYERTL